MVKPAHHVDLAGLGRHHDDGNGAGGRILPQAGQNGIAVLVGQHDIQDHQLGQTLVHGMPEALAVGKALDLKIVGLQGVLLQLPYAGVVLHNIDH